MKGDGGPTASGTSGPDRGDDWVGGPDLVASLGRYRLAVLVVTLVAAVVGYAVSLLLPVRYDAQARLYLHDPGSPSILSLNGSSQSQGDHAVFMATQAGLAGSHEVFGRALRVLGRDGTTEDVRRSVVVASSPDLASITITASADDPAAAADLANAVGAAYQQVAGERIAADSKDAITRLQEVMAQRSAEFDSLRADAARATGSAQAPLERKALHVADLIGALQIHQDEIAAQAALYGSGVTAFERATPPVSSAQPAPFLLALFGAALGLVAAGAWAWWAAGRNPRVEGEGDACAVLRAPLLGETLRLGGKRRGIGASSVRPYESDMAAAEVYHVVLGAVAHALSKVGGKVVAVVSAGPGDGKTTTAFNLALAGRREGRKVLLVDADERTLRLSQMCRYGGAFDVIGVSHDADECASVTEQAALGGENSAVELTGTVLQIGSTERNGQHPASFFRSPTFGKLISFSSAPTDLVLIDTPALLGPSETVAIADHADAVLLVVKHGSSVADLRRARERLAFSDTPLIGYVLNHVSAPRASAGAGDGRGQPIRTLRRWFTARLPQEARAD